MSFPPLLFKLSKAVALLASANLLALGICLVTNSRGSAALGANKLDLICIESALSLDQAAGLAHLAGLNVLSDDVDALDDDLAFGGADLHDLASLASVLAVDDDDFVALLNMNLIHHPHLRLKYFGSE